MEQLADIVVELERTLGRLGGAPVALGGGITNRNYRATFGGEEYVIRMHGRDTELLGIDRKCERVASCAAARLGIAPEVVAAREDWLVTRYVECSAVSELEVAREAGVIGLSLRRLHDSGTQLPSSFSVPALLEDYSRLVRARGDVLAPAYEHARQAAGRIARALGTPEQQPCHNDLLAGNIIRAREGGGLMIVDWEYAGMGDARFDLGNVAVNNDFDEDAESRMLIAYLSREPTPRERAALKLMRVLSDAREAAWGVMQGVLSDLDFDFAGYAREHFERMGAAVQEPRFEEWLALAAG